MHERFDMLRRAAAAAMAGRRWSMGPVGLHLQVFGAKPERTVLDYAAGVMDSLDGSHGPAVTYLPVAYNDDCQVCDSTYLFTVSESEHYVEYRCQREEVRSV